MLYVGIDVHKEESQICILEDKRVRQLRIKTTKQRLEAVFGQMERSRLLLESSTESEWVARCLESLGHEVIVADPNFAAMYATRSRRVKTDQRDAQTLAEACRLGRTVQRIESAMNGDLSGSSCRCGRRWLRRGPSTSRRCAPCCGGKESGSPAAAPSALSSGWTECLCPSRCGPSSSRSWPCCAR